MIIVDIEAVPPVVHKIDVWLLQVDTKIMFKLLCLVYCIEISSQCLLGMSAMHCIEEDFSIIKSFGMFFLTL